MPSSFGARLRSRVPQYGHSVMKPETSDPQFLHTTKRSGAGVTGPTDRTGRATRESGFASRSGARSGASALRGWSYRVHALARGADDLAHDLAESWLAS